MYVCMDGWMDTVYCILYTVYCITYTVYSVQYTVYSIQSHTDCHLADMLRAPGYVYHLYSTCARVSRSARYARPDGLVAHVVDAALGLGMK